MTKTKLQKSIIVVNTEEYYELQYVYFLNYLNDIKNTYPKHSFNRIINKFNDILDKEDY
jgi:hypothetical protein